MRALARGVVAVVVVVVVVVAGASSSSCGGPLPAAEVGRQLFADPRTSVSAFNAFSCATCHDDGSGEAAARIYPGAPMNNVVFRSSWWGGQAQTLRDAVDNCVVFFMRDQKFADDDPRGRALYEYLLSISPETQSENVPLTVVENVVASLPRGDPRRGEEVWNAACAACHGAPHTGEGRLNEFVSLVPEASAEFAADIGFPVDVVVAEKVRHGPFFGVGGNMPPFSREVMSDEDLGALIAFLLPE